MERYKKYAKEIKGRDGKLRYSSTYYPVIPLRDSDIYTYSRQGQRLDLLAFDAYGDPRYWWVIARANNLGLGTLQVTPGRRLRIPFPVDEVYLDKLK
jgi:hypothetical protein